MANTCGHVLQVGWRRSGLGLWTPSGCRLVCSLRQARAQAGSQAQAQNSLYRGGAPLSLEVGQLLPQLPALPFEPCTCSVLMCVLTSE